MAALTTGGTAPEHCFGGCHGCHGGWGCHGCHGGWGCHGCCGCWGGCYCGGWCGGYGCYGCYGGGWGCWGGYSTWAYGCYGGCYGGCWGGCYGGYGGYGTVVPGAVAPADSGSEGLPSPKPEDKDKSKTEATNRARLIVEVPADARLYIDDRAMKTTSDVRTFSTPDLEPGQLYYYEVRAEVVRDGKPVSQTKRVIVRAGATVRASFTDLGGEPITTAKK
jgi:uncharacterized protein (TIGR03000 family)